ncbi:hypothetical protein PHYSODRAFT_296613 [Phytophthora sojae]|uniref:Uncharacterized protein n=1 Tax=Phytophthora sojae (strain P6497) TaxID=1094619 RepID=G4YZA4_PHYSP|nr:hypothetical protein PHYSODRAFT_296613 [Phytophthora sojae]EGZ24579.1 hypothetical protein PHYSODRAFT_296613 [Phytophthora sojae]|eukprot:XP_009519867.1 hypothetical protein PHYSODRAFT_296613 [Phytophthora sojae]
MDTYAVDSAKTLCSYETQAQRPPRSELYYNIAMIQGAMSRSGTISSERSHPSQPGPAIFMRRRHCIRVVRTVVVVVQCSIWCQAQVAAADCWIGSNGKEICNTDPTGLRATWWFFFVLLLFAGVATGCFDADWGLCGSKDNNELEAGQDTGISRLENGLPNEERGLSVSLVQPLLGGREADKMQHQATPSPPKPVYRYFDP